MTGCSLFSGSSNLHTSAKGSIQLHEVSDWAFEATHPAVIDRITMMKIITGVLADDPRPALTSMPASGSKPMRVFSDEDAEFLAPLLANGLSQAKSDQLVGFTVSSSAGSGNEPTAGTLYVQGGSLYLTLSPVRGRKASAFMPAGAARIEKAPSFAAVSGGMSVVVDYQLLAKHAPGPTPYGNAKPLAGAPVAGIPAVKLSGKAETVPVRSAAASNLAETAVADISNDELLNKKLDELRQAREMNKTKETEIAMLRKEASSMKRELRERSEEIKALRTGRVTAQRKKAAEAYPNR